MRDQDTIGTTSTRTHFRLLQHAQHKLHAPSSSSQGSRARCAAQLPRCVLGHMLLPDVHYHLATHLDDAVTTLKLCMHVRCVPLAAGYALKHYGVTEWPAAGLRSTAADLVSELRVGGGCST